MGEAEAAGSVMPELQNDPQPDFFLYFLKVQPDPAFRPEWIRVDQVVRVCVINVSSTLTDGICDRYGVLVETIGGRKFTVMKVSSEKIAETVMARVLQEISMRVPLMAGRH